ncbi:amidohydrolase [Spirosoma arcticum]
MIEPLLALRHDLHQHPEVAGEEVQTARRIVDFINQYAPTEIVENLGGHGVAAVYRFGPGGPTILFRCELDALPIQEINTFAHRSVTAGVAHKCGHDGHMAVVAGLAPWLGQCAFGAGTVILLFQPAEETAKGAEAVLNDPRFARLKPDYVFALHNIPGFALHQLLWQPRQFSATVQSIAISLFGKESHAAEPENGVNPARAIAELIQSFNQFAQLDKTSPDFALITPVHVLMGQKQYGISAGYGELHLTLRTWRTSRMEEIVTTMNECLAIICDSHKLRYETEWFDFFPATTNNNFCNEVVVQAATKNGLTITQQQTPFKFGEDFGWFTQRYPGAMFGLGAGETTPALHNPDYDFPDELIGTGVALFRRITEQLMAEEIQTVKRMVEVVLVE